HNMLVQLDGGLAADLVQLMTRQPFRGDGDFRAWMQRLARYPALLAAARERLEAGIEHGVTTPRVLVERSLDQWARVAADEPRKSTLWTPAQRYGPALQEEYEKLLAATVLPAMREFVAFVRERYLPQAR